SEVSRITPSPPVLGGRGRGEGGQHPSIGLGLLREILTPLTPRPLSPRVQVERGVEIPARNLRIGNGTRKFRDSRVWQGLVDIGLAGGVLALVFGLTKFYLGARMRLPGLDQWSVNFIHWQNRVVGALVDVSAK